MHHGRIDPRTSAETLSLAPMSMLTFSHDASGDEIPQTVSISARIILRAPVNDDKRGDQRQRRLASAVNRGKKQPVYY